MQTTAALRLGRSSLTRARAAHLSSRLSAPSVVELSSARGGWAISCPPASRHGFDHRFDAMPLRQFGSKTAADDRPVHATPHYMDYDTLVDMHLVTRQSFGNRPLFGTKPGGQGSPPFEWMTYKDFGKRVDQCRAALDGLGVARGDKVGIVSNNRQEWAVCAYATYSLGAVFVPMYEEQVGGRCSRYNLLEHNSTESRDRLRLRTLFFLATILQQQSSTYVPGTGIYQAQG